MLWSRFGEHPFSSHSCLQLGAGGLLPFDKVENDGRGRPRVLLLVIGHAHGTLRVSFDCLHGTTFDFLTQL